MFSDGSDDGGFRMINAAGFYDAVRAVMTPGEPGRGLPNPAYVDEDVFTLEQQAVFAETWSCIGFDKDVPDAGDVFPLNFLDQPLVMVRGSDGAIRVFHNVCSHRGMILVEEAGNTRGLMRCPYHSWCYNLNGDLKRTPYIGGPEQDDHPCFDKSEHGLRAVRSTASFGLVFVNLSGDAPDFEVAHSDFLSRWAEFKDVPMVHGGPDSTLNFTLETNWKLAVENYCESYHLPWVHPSLNVYSKIEDHYNINVWGQFSGQGTTVYAPTLIEGSNRAFPELPGLSDIWKTGAEYIALYPNVLLGVHKDHAFAILITPDGPGRCHERVEIFYYDEACTGPDYADLRGANAVGWQQVFAEDVGVVEGMQRGRTSSGFKGGVFSPVLDTPTRCFHMWVADKYLAFSEPHTLAAE